MITKTQADKLKELMWELRHADEMYVEYVYTNYNKDGPEGYIAFQEECESKYLQYLDEITIPEG